MKKDRARIRKAAVISLLLVLIIVILMICMRQTLLLRWLFFKQTSQNYGSFRLERIRLSDDHKISCEFETKNPRAVLAESLALRQDIEALLAAHPDIYGDYLLECTFSTDSASGYIRYANFERLTGARNVPYASLAYGDFHSDIHGELGGLEAFRTASSFAYLYFLDFNTDDFSALDSHTALKKMTLVSCNNVSEDDLDDFRRTHPDCEIS